MRRLRPGAGIGDLSLRRLNRAFDQTAEPVGVSPSTISSILPYTKAIARNKTGYTVKPGAPVLVGKLWPDEDGVNFGGRIPGFYDVYEPKLPSSSAELSTILTNGCDPNRVAIVLEEAENDACMSIAIDGVVQANFQSGDGFYACLRFSSEANYRDRIVGSASMGFGQIIARFATENTCILRLGNSMRCILGQTKSGGLVTGSEGAVFYKVPSSTGWTVTSVEYPAWTETSNIGGNKPVVSLPVDGRWFTLLHC